MSSPLPQSRVRVQRIAEAAVERARLTVVPRTRVVRAPRVPFVTLVSALLLAGVVGLLMFNTSMQQNAFTTTALEAEAAELNSQEETLRMELDDLRDPQHVAQRANELGMVIPQNPSFLTLSGRVLGPATAATPEDRLPVTVPPPAKPKALDPDPVRVEVKAAADEQKKPRHGSKPRRNR